MRTTWLLTGPGASLLFLAFVVIACGGDGRDVPDPTATEALEPPPPSVVNVRLFEWSVSPDVESVAAGTVTFNASNIGADNHALLIIRTDLAVDTLPMLEDGLVDTAAEGIDIVGEILDIAPDRELSDAFDLVPGAYALICNVVTEVEDVVYSHYPLGMRIGFEVTE